MPPVDTLLKLGFIEALHVLTLVCLLRDIMNPKKTSNTIKDHF